MRGLSPSAARERGRLEASLLAVSRRRVDAAVAADIDAAVTTALGQVGESLAAGSVALVQTAGDEVVRTHGRGAEPGSGSRRILVVKRVLAGQGYRVLIARTAAEALRLCEGEAVDLLPTDVILPGLGGRALADRVREIQAGARLLFMSGCTADEALPAELLANPFAPAEPLTRVRDALARETSIDTDPSLGLTTKELP